jgi:hypothetical protein
MGLHGLEQGYLYFTLTAIAGVKEPCFPIKRKASVYVYKEIRCRYCDATGEKDIFLDYRLWIIDSLKCEAM